MSSSKPTGPSLPTTSKNVPSASQEPKARGANRSTKVAGKLKVLPDQPEPPTPVPDTHLEPPPPPKLQEGEGSGTAGDSEDDDADVEEEPEDAEVFFNHRNVSTSHSMPNATPNLIGIHPD